MPYGYPKYIGKDIVKAFFGPAVFALVFGPDLLPSFLEKTLQH